MSDSRVPIDLRRRADARLQVSRIVADLFWQNGVAATRGEDIAAAAGIATRTLWRYFRSKESCVEPILLESSQRMMVVLTNWPLELSINEFLGRTGATGPVSYSTDDVRAMRTVVLGFEHPSLRSAWLMVCDEAERATWPLFARRLDLPPDSHEVRRIAAAVAGGIRALNDALSTDFVASGRAPDSATVLEELASTIREASGGRLGGATTAE